MFPLPRVSAEFPTLKKQNRPKSGACSDGASFFRPTSGRSGSSVLHSPTIIVFQLEKIEDCAHVVVNCASLFGGKPLKCNVAASVSFSPPAVRLCKCVKSSDGCLEKKKKFHRYIRRFFYNRGKTVPKKIVHL